MLLEIKTGIPKWQVLTRILATNCITSCEKYKTHRHTTFVEATRWTCSCTTILLKLLFCLYLIGKRLDRREENGIRNGPWVGTRGAHKAMDQTWIIKLYLSWNNIPIANNRKLNPIPNPKPLTITYSRVRGNQRETTDWQEVLTQSQPLNPTVTIWYLFDNTVGPGPTTLLIQEHVLHDILPFHLRSVRLWKSIEPTDPAARVKSWKLMLHSCLPSRSKFWKGMLVASIWCMSSVCWSHSHTWYLVQFCGWRSWDQSRLV